MLKAIKRDNVDKNFKESITLRDYIEICNEFKGEIPTKFNWWLKYSKFGKFFLNKTCLIEHINVSADRKNWFLYIGVLRRYFLTHKEHRNIIRNTGFLKGVNESLVEDSNFQLYFLGRLKGSRVSYLELLNMNYKTFYKLYLYNIGETIRKDNNG